MWFVVCVPSLSVRISLGRIGKIIWRADMPNRLESRPTRSPCRQRQPMSAKFADNVACRRHVADMSPTFPAKSARDLKNPCPSSLLQALAPDNVDRDTWAASYKEETDALKDANTFTVIDLARYRELRKAGAPRAIPTMCVLVIKPNEKFEPDRAKSRVVVLGNLDDRPWCKHERAAPVMKYSSFRLTVSSAIAVKRRLKQGDFHNAFCNPHLPPEEITIVRPPLGDPNAKEGEYWLLNKTLYGLCRSPRHWYEMLVSILLNMGLTQSRHDPCLFHGVPSTPEHPAMPGDPPITIGIYVDDFVYFSLSDDVEERFEKILSKDLKVTFMGVATWFLGTHLTWLSLANGHIRRPTSPAPIDSTRAASVWRCRASTRNFSASVSRPSKSGSVFGAAPT